jgi:sugar/nucleoside kinase (ribokinase family)
MSARFDVIAVGHAIVDVLAHVDDAFLTSHSIAKGAMTLIDAFRAETLERAMRKRVEASGGSAANTAVGVASFGGKAAFIGKVRDDHLGESFRTEIRKADVTFESASAHSGLATASSHILVTPDGQRSMNTFLGCASALDAGDMDAKLIGAAKILYVEGYLWDTPGAKMAIRAAIAHAKAAKRQVAFTLSDPFCVGRWRDEFKALLKTDVDILFANEAEVKALFETEHFDQAFQAVRSWKGKAALTRSAHGSVCIDASDVHILEAEPVSKVEDTTGAGDQYAAGFLYGVARGVPLGRCGRLGGIAAAEVIGHLGPRPHQSLRSLAAKAGIN